MTRILVIQTAFLGDVVLTTPLLRELRRAHPQARIAVLTTPLGAEVLRGASSIDRIYPYDKRAGLYGVRGLVRSVRRIRRDGPVDVCVAAHRSYRTGILTRGTGATRRIGYVGASGAWAYTDLVPWNPGAHAVDRYLALAGPAGGDPESANARPRIELCEQDTLAADGRLEALGVPAGRPLVCVAPGSHWAAKRWLPERFGAVAGSLVRRGRAVVIVGNERERALCEQVAGVAGDGAVNAAGKLAVRELIAVLARAEVLIGNDSGPAHAAGAVETPVVAVFGPTTPSLGFTPLGPAIRIVELEGLDCRPCHRHGPNRCPLEHFRCMREITPDEVMTVVRELPGVSPVEAK